MPQKDVENGPTEYSALKHSSTASHAGILGSFWFQGLTSPKSEKMIASCDFIFSNSNHCIKISHHHSVLQLTLIAVSSVFNFCTCHTKCRTNLRNTVELHYPKPQKPIKNKKTRLSNQKASKPQPPQWIWWHRLQPWSSNSTSVSRYDVSVHDMWCVEAFAMINDKWYKNIWINKENLYK